MLATIIRENIKALVPYASARSDYKGSAAVWLDANENSYGCAAGSLYNRYPDPLQQVLKEQVARLKGVAADQVFLGNGSDEPIDLLIRICCVPGQDNILVMPPTYGMYEVSARINDVAVKEVPLAPAFRVDAAAVLAAVDPQTRIIFICSPNNPTGNLVPADVVQTIAAAFAGLVVLDEAYIDFAAVDSLLPQLSAYPNLVILQTFSKAWGMAGLRLGMAFAAPELVSVLNKIKPPYNISAPVQELALAALAQEAQVTQWIQAIVQEREALRQSLEALAVVQEVYPSAANFLLVRMMDARAVYHYLAAAGIITRDRSKVSQCAGCLRITVGRPDENQALLAALQQYSSDTKIPL